MPEKTYSNIEVTKKENAEVEIRGEIPLHAVGEYRKSVLQELSKETAIPGFRKGHVPENLLTEKVGEPVILEKIAGKALSEAYGHIVRDHAIAAIGAPQITVTKLAPNNPIGFTIAVATYPAFTLPNHTLIAKEVLRGKTDAEISVSDQELDEAVSNILKNASKSDESGEKELTLTDELVQSWNFKNVDDLKAKLRGDMQKQKETREKEKTRIAITDAILAKTDIPLPNVFIDAELNKMLAEFKGNIKSMGLSFEDYIKRIEKTENDLREEWKPDAQKRAKMQLLLKKIAEEENIKASEEKVEERMKHILEHHKDANPDTARAYITAILTNEKVFEFLESQE